MPFSIGDKVQVNKLIPVPAGIGAHFLRKRRLGEGEIKTFLKEIRGEKWYLVGQGDFDLSAYAEGELVLKD